MIKSKNIFHFLYLVFSSIIFLSFIIEGKSDNEGEKKVIIIPFKSYVPKGDDYPNKSKLVLNSFVRKKYYLDIENESGQKLAMLLNTEEPQMHTRDKVALIRSDDETYKPYTETDPTICKFNYKTSNTYKFLTEFNHSFYSVKYTCYASEKMNFYSDLQLKDKKNYDIQFIHTSNETTICFFGCLQLTYSLVDEKVNLFIQLKRLINSGSYSWTLKFNSPDDGYFIFGDIIGNKELQFYSDNIEENYYHLPIQVYDPSRIFWKIPIEKICFDNYNIKPDTKLDFFLDFQIRYIILPKHYFYNITSKYFLNNENIPSSDRKFICFEEHENFIFSIYCDKKAYLELTDNYKKLPTLDFFSYELGINITFKPKELFLEIDDRIYFFIGYKTSLDYDEECFMGNIFLEKYITVFNNPEKKMSVLKLKDTDENDSDKEGNNNNGDGNSKKIALIIILIIILCALVFGVIGIFFGKKIYQARKKKANELNDDEFDYSPQSINTEQNPNI